MNSFEKFDFFRNPFVALVMGLGDHLVTIWVREQPWGPMWLLLGPCSLGHPPPPPESPQIAAFYAPHEGPPPVECCGREG